MPKRKGDLDRDEYQRLYQRCRYRGIHMHGYKESSDDLREFIKTCMNEQREKERLTKQQRLQRLKRKFEKIKLEDDLRKLKESRPSFPTVELPRNMPADYFKGNERKKTAHEKLTEVMSESESGGMEYKRLMRLLKKLEAE